MNVSYLLRGGSRHCRWKFLGQLSHFAIFPDAPPHMQQLSPPAAYNIKNQQELKSQIGMIIKTLHYPHANVLLAKVALRDCPNELYPPTQTWFFYRLVNTWPSTRIAWQANRTLASVTKVLLAPNETILQKDCMRSKTNVSHYAEFYGSRCSPR